MDIRNATEFRNFLNIAQLRGLHQSFDAVCHCMMDYERGCDCWKSNQKQKVYENCKMMYQNAVALAMCSYKGQFLARTPDGQICFFQDGRPIGTMRR